MTPCHPLPDSSYISPYDALELARDIGPCRSIFMARMPLASGIPTSPLRAQSAACHAQLLIGADGSTRVEIFPIDPIRPTGKLLPRSYSAEEFAQRLQYGDIDVLPPVPARAFRRQLADAWEDFWDQGRGHYASMFEWLSRNM